MRGAGLLIFRITLLIFSLLTPSIFSGLKLNVLYRRLPYLGESSTITRILH